RPGHRARRGASAERGARRRADRDDAGDRDARNGAQVLPAAGAPGRGGKDRLAGRSQPLPRLLVVRRLRSARGTEGGSGGGGGERAALADPGSLAGARSDAAGAGSARLGPARLGQRSSISPCSTKPLKQRRASSSWIGETWTMASTVRCPSIRERRERSGAVSGISRTTAGLTLRCGIFPPYTSSVFSWSASAASA